MALIICQECNKKISDKAISCPNCGLPMKQERPTQIVKESKYTQRSDGRWHTQLNTGKYNESGKPIRIPLYASSEKELIKLVNKTKYEIEHGTYAHDKGITFGAYANKWLAVAKASRGIKTKAMYSNIIKNHINCFEHKRLKDITRSDIQLQINESSDTPRICEQIKITVKQIFASAVDDGLIIKSPYIGIELPRRVTKEKRALTDIEKKALKSAVLSNTEKAFIYILYGCGLRPGELYALSRSDIDFKNNEIVISKALTFDGKKPVVVFPKTNSGIRRVEAPLFVINAIQNHVDENSNLILFCDEKGNYRTKSSYYNLFNQIVKKMKLAIGENNTIHEVKISDLTQYTFRHNYCTELYYSDISLKEAQRLMGHSDYNMIMKVYSHLDEKKENTKNKLEKLIL